MRQCLLIETWDAPFARPEAGKLFECILVQNRTVRLPLMPSQQNRRVGTLTDRVRRQTELRALEEAKRVPWKLLAKAADDYTEWQAFSLWIRAVVEAAKSVPAVVVQEVRARAPQLLGRIGSDTEAGVTTGRAVGPGLWQEVSQWAEVNIFAAAKRGGWLGAVRYFSAMSLRSMNAWAHWEQAIEQWCLASPKVFPTYAQWQTEVADVTRLSNPDGPAQYLLDCVREIPEMEWNSILSGYSELIVFSLWMELVLDVEGPNSRLASKELAKRYRGFRLPDSATGSKEVVRSLNDWAIEHALGIVSQEHVLAALSFYVIHHPAYCALRSYALHCHDAWPKECLDHPPSFEEWRHTGDAYFEK